MGEKKEEIIWEERRVITEESKIKLHEVGECDN